MNRRRLLEAEVRELREQVEVERVRRAKLEDAVQSIKAWKQQQGSYGSDNMSRLLDALAEYLD